LFGSKSVVEFPHRRRDDGLVANVIGNSEMARAIRQAALAIWLLALGGCGYSSDKVATNGMPVDTPHDPCSGGN
jgi:hypothetical protein